MAHRGRDPRKIVTCLQCETQFSQARGIKPSKFQYKNNPVFNTCKDPLGGLTWKLHERCAAGDVSDETMWKIPYDGERTMRRHFACQH